MKMVLGRGIKVSSINTFYGPKKNKTESRNILKDYFYN